MARMPSLLVALVVVSGLGARPAAAEWFLDLYGGGAFTQDVDASRWGA
jgi:hypothetical protein